MPNYILFDTPQDWENLLPLTFTRPVAGLRVGIWTIAEKWEYYLGQKISFQTQNYLTQKFPLHLTNDNVFINSSVLPNVSLVAEIQQLQPNEGIVKEGKFVAIRGGNLTENLDNCRFFNPVSTFLCLEKLPDIFRLNGQEIQADFNQIRSQKPSQKIQDKYTAIYGEENIFVEEGVKIKASILNAENGVIYLGKNSQVQEGSMIQGNFSLGANSVINMGGKMRGDTTIGQHCKVGGEVSNCVIFGFSNKAHDGFLGNSVLGEWCNLGADTNNSNLKNNYGSVKIWNYHQHQYENTGLTFCGLFMGDHSKAGINTMFNTGTVVGVCANVFGAGFPKKYISSFSWGENEVFGLEKACEVAQRVMQRRGLVFNEVEKNILENVWKREIK